MGKAPNVPAAEEALAKAPTDIPNQSAEKTTKRSKTSPPEVPPPLPIDLTQPSEPLLQPNVAEIPESSFDRHEVIEDNAVKREASPGMTSLKEVLAQHTRATKPAQNKLKHPPLALSEATQGQVSMRHPQLLLSSPVYRRAIITGAGGGFIVVAILLFIQAY